MEPRRIIRTDIAASVIAHLTLVGLIILVSEVHPFHAPPTETVSVDIVTPDALKEKAPEPAPSPEPPLPDLAAKDKPEPASPPSPPDPPQQQASPQPQQSSPAPRQHEANAQPQPQAQPAPQAQPPQQAPSFTPPEPDITVKYGVMLGLPAELPPLPKNAPQGYDKQDDGGDGKDALAARLPANVVAEFRRHLKTCAKLPASVAPSDNVHIKLRAVLTVDGQLARPPILIEASASPTKGLALLQSATSALQACQPYSMLPADKYQEWKVLDLTFTPRDFGAS